MSMRGDPNLVPPSIRDARGKAFGATMRDALGEPDFRVLLFERIDEAPASVLPFLVREFGLQKFIEPGMSEAVVRRMLKGSFELHATIGYVGGVKRGLEMLGLAVSAWEQWFQRQPPGPPGTHVVTAALAGEVFPGEGLAITERLARAMGRMVDGMKRWSQDVGFRIRTEATAGVGAAMIVTGRIRIAPTGAPLTYIAGTTPAFAGMVVAGRIRIRPEA